MVSKNFETFCTRGALFIGIGLVLYAGFYAISEMLVYRYASANTFYRVHIADRPVVDRILSVATSDNEAIYDYVILGSSHAMPFDFHDMNARLEKMTNTRIINLSMPGGGILPSRLAAEYFLKKHYARNMIYVFDAPVLYFDEWNEERLKNASIFKRAPFDPDLAGLLVSYALRGKTSWGTVVDYTLGFSKINNQDRFAPDVPDMEKQFTRVAIASKRRYAQRIAYLFPKKMDEAAFNRHLDDFKSLIGLLKAKNIQLIAMETPLPAEYYQMMPGAREFDQKMEEWLRSQGVPFYNFSLACNAESNFYDTDHLNRDGVLKFFDEYFSKVLIEHAKSRRGNLADGA